LKTRIVIEPLGIPAMLSPTGAAAGVLSDSGSRQEETALDVPCTTLREQTESQLRVEWGPID
jgi:UDP-N-acetylglucosamine 2-epimerase